MLEFDLWQLLVEQLMGGFWLAVVALIGVIFLIMGVLGKMSKFTVTYYCTLFLFVMTLGFGFNFIALLILVGYIAYLYITFKNATSS